MIRIKCDGGVSQAAQITTEDGTEIRGIRSLNLRMEPNSVVTADMEVIVGQVDVTAHPLLGLETLKEAAAAHGYALVAYDDATTIGGLEFRQFIRAGVPHTPPPPKPKR